MKAGLHLTWELFASLLFLTLIGVACQTVREKEISLPVKVLRVKGAARYAAVEGGTWHGLKKKGQVLKSGCVIQTARDTYVDVLLGVPASREMFPDPRYEMIRNVLRVLPDTILRIDKLTERQTKSSKQSVEEIRVHLSQGSVFGSFNQLVGESNCEVRFTNGLACMKNAVFLVGAEGVVAVVRGAVTITTSINATREIPAGFQFDYRTGELTKVPPHLRFTPHPSYVQPLPAFPSDTVPPRRRF